MCRSLMRIFFIPHCFIRARTNPPQQASLQCCIAMSKNKQQTKLNDPFYIPMTIRSYTLFHSLFHTVNGLFPVY
jgi:hypothetical protein